MDAPGAVLQAEQVHQGPYPGLAEERLTHPGFGSGIPPVTRKVPRPRSAMPGATWAAVVSAPPTLTAQAPS